MHIVKCDAYTNAHCVKAMNVFAKLCACIHVNINMHTSYTLTHSHTHIWIQTLKDSQLYIHQNTFMPTHTSMCQHPHIHPHTHSFTHTRAHKHIHKHTHTHIHTHTCTHACTSTYTHVCANANTDTCLQNKIAFTDTTYIHSQIHSFANTRP